MKGSLLNCGDGKESHTKARTWCCSCRWKSKIAAFECSGYTEFHVWFLCGVCVYMSVIHGIKCGSDFVLLFVDSDMCIFSFFSVFSITWSGRKEQTRSYVYHFLNFTWKQWMPVVWMCTQADITGPFWRCVLHGCCYSSVSKRLALPVLSIFSVLLKHWEYGQDCKGPCSVHPEYTHNGCTWCRHKTKAARQHSD